MAAPWEGLPLSSIPASVGALEHGVVLNVSGQIVPVPLADGRLRKSDLEAELGRWGAFDLCVQAEQGVPRWTSLVFDSCGMSVAHLTPGRVYNCQFCLPTVPTAAEPTIGNATAPHPRGDGGRTRITHMLCGAVPVGRRARALQMIQGPRNSLLTK